MKLLLNTIYTFEAMYEPLSHRDISELVKEIFVNSHITPKIEDNSQYLLGFLKHGVFFFVMRKGTVDVASVS